MSVSAALIVQKDTACPLDQFSDLDSSAWYHDGIDYCLKNGLMKGKSTTSFDPSGKITRAEFVTVLYRIAQSAGEGFTGAWAFNLDYTDKADIPEYAFEAVAWCSMNKLVGGYANGAFGPKDPITREQFAAILYRYAEFMKQDVSVDENTNFLSFNDFWDVSEYARTPMMWAIERNIIGGSNGDLNPAFSATRAEAAAMLQRFCKLNEKTPDAAAGGWQINEELAETKLPAGAKEAFEQAMDGMVGADFTPVAYLGSQFVAGVNYAYLCKEVTVTAQPETKLAAVVVYKNPQGEVSVYSVKDVNLAECTAESETEFLPANFAGGWKLNTDTAQLPEGVQGAFEKAMEGLFGVGYTPLACMGSQVVAGTNYAVLCTAKAVTAEPANALAVVVVNAPVSGGAQILRICGFSIY